MGAIKEISLKEALANTNLAKNPFKGMSSIEMLECMNKIKFLKDENSIGDAHKTEVILSLVIKDADSLQAIAHEYGLEAKLDLVTFFREMRKIIERDEGREGSSDYKPNPTYYDFICEILKHADTYGDILDLDKAPTLDDYIKKAYAENKLSKSILDGVDGIVSDYKNLTGNMSKEYDNFGVDNYKTQMLRIKNAFGVKMYVLDVGKNATEKELAKNVKHKKFKVALTSRLSNKKQGEGFLCAPTKERKVTYYAKNKRVVDGANGVKTLSKNETLLYALYDLNERALTKRAKVIKAMIKNDVQANGKSDEFIADCVANVIDLAKVLATRYTLFGLDLTNYSKFDPNIAFDFRMERIFLEKVAGLSMNKKEIADLAVPYAQELASSMAIEFFIKSKIEPSEIKSNLTSASKVLPELKRNADFGTFKGVMFNSEMLAIEQNVCLDKVLKPKMKKIKAKVLGAFKSFHGTKVKDKEESMSEEVKKDSLFARLKNKVSGANNTENVSVEEATANAENEIVAKDEQVEQVETENVVSVEEVPEQVEQEDELVKNDEVSEDVVKTSKLTKLKSKLGNVGARFIKKDNAIEDKALEQSVQSADNESVEATETIEAKEENKESIIGKIKRKIVESAIYSGIKRDPQEDNKEDETVEMPEHVGEAIPNAESETLNNDVEAGNVEESAKQEQETALVTGKEQIVEDNQQSIELEKEENIDPKQKFEKVYQIFGETKVCNLMSYEEYCENFVESVLKPCAKMGKMKKSYGKFNKIANAEISIVEKLEYAVGKDLLKQCYLGYRKSATEIIEKRTVAYQNELNYVNTAINNVLKDKIKEEFAKGELKDERRIDLLKSLRRLPADNAELINVDALSPVFDTIVESIKSINNEQNEEQLKDLHTRFHIQQGIELNDFLQQYVENAVNLKERVIKNNNVLKVGKEKVNEFAQALINSKSSDLTNIQKEKLRITLEILNEEMESEHLVQTEKYSNYIAMCKKVDGAVANNASEESCEVAFAENVSANEFGSCVVDLISKTLKNSEIKINIAELETAKRDDEQIDVNDLDGVFKIYFNKEVKNSVKELLDGSVYCEPSIKEKLDVVADKIAEVVNGENFEKALLALNIKKYYDEIKKIAENESSISEKIIVASYLNNNKEFKEAVNKVVFDVVGLVYVEEDVKENNTLVAGNAEKMLSTNEQKMLPTGEKIMLPSGPKIKMPVEKKNELPMESIMALINKEEKILPSEKNKEVQSVEKLGLTGTEQKMLPTGEKIMLPSGEKSKISVETKEELPEEPIMALFNVEQKMLPSGEKKMLASGEERALPSSEKNVQLTSEVNNEVTDVVKGVSSKSKEIDYNALSVKATKVKLFKATLRNEIKNILASKMADIQKSIDQISAQDKQLKKDYVIYFKTYGSLRRYYDSKEKNVPYSGIAESTVIGVKKLIDTYLNKNVVKQIKTDKDFDNKTLEELIKEYINVNELKDYVVGLIDSNSMVCVDGKASFGKVFNGTQRVNKVQPEKQVKPERVAPNIALNKKTTLDQFMDDNGVNDIKPAQTKKATKSSSKAKKHKDNSTTQVQLDDYYREF